MNQKLFVRRNLPKIKYLFKIYGGILIVIFITFFGVSIDINPAFAVLVACLGIGITIHGIANQGFYKPDHLKENEENDK